MSNIKIKRYSNMENNSNNQDNDHLTTKDIFKLIDIYEKKL